MGGLLRVGFGDSLLLQELEQRPLVALQQELADALALSELLQYGRYLYFFLVLLH